MKQFSNRKIPKFKKQTSKGYIATPYLSTIDTKTNLNRRSGSGELSYMSIRSKFTNQYGGGTPSIMPAVHTPVMKKSVLTAQPNNRLMMSAKRRGPTPTII